MSDPVFLDLGMVLRIHQDQVKRYGGDTGVRDMGMLQSAIAMPAMGFGDTYVHGDIYEMAATYLFHIVSNHPFVDGNKRAGAVVAFVFLDLNGIDLDANPDEFEELVLAVARSETDKGQIARFFRDNSRPLACRCRQIPIAHRTKLMPRTSH